MNALAISTYSLRRWQSERGETTERVLETIRELGVEAVEFAGLDEAAEQIGPLARAEQLRRCCEEKGLKVAGYCVAAELLAAPAEQRKVVEAVKAQVDVAAALGARTMRHDVTRGWDLAKHAARVPGPHTFAAAVRTVVPAIRAIADHGQTRGVITSLENHGFYMQASTRVEKLINAVGHPNFRLTLDMGNFLCVNEDPVAAVRRLVKYAVMVHVKDFHVKRKAAAPSDGWFATPTPIALRGAIVGHGAIDIPAQLRVLGRAGYSGYLSLEFEGIEDSIDGVRRGLQYLRQRLSPD